LFQNLLNDDFYFNGLDSIFYCSDSGNFYWFKVVGNLLDLERSQEDYERLVTTLLQWIYAKIGELNDRNFANSLDGIKSDMAKFTDYRVKEKPPKLVVFSLRTSVFNAWRVNFAVRTYVCCVCELC
jgi:sensor domain CHASE-containing protein